MTKWSTGARAWITASKVSAMSLYPFYSNIKLTMAILRIKYSRIICGMLTALELFLHLIVAPVISFPYTKRTLRIPRPIHSTSRGIRTSSNRNLQLCLLLCHTHRRHTHRSHPTTLRRAWRRRLFRNCCHYTARTSLISLFPRLLRYSENTQPQRSLCSRCSVLLFGVWTNIGITVSSHCSC